MITVNHWNINLQHDVTLVLSQGKTNIYMRSYMSHQCHAYESSWQIVKNRMVKGVGKMFSPMLQWVRQNEYFAKYNTMCVDILMLDSSPGKLYDVRKHPVRVLECSLNNHKQQVSGNVYVTLFLCEYIGNYNNVLGSDFE